MTHHKIWGQIMAHDGTQPKLTQIIADPFSFYKAPGDVLRDDHFEHADKMRILEAMEHDAVELSTAAGENMAGGETVPLDEILDAKRTLSG